MPTNERAAKNFRYMPANHHIGSMYASKKEKFKSLKKQQHLLIGPPVQALQTLTNERGV
jgi:hypothetical protein